MEFYNHHYKWLRVRQAIWLGEMFVTEKKNSLRVSLEREVYCLIISALLSS